MSQNKSSAVMEQRAGASVEADGELRALYRKLEYFPTPPWAARAMGELAKTLDPLAERVWEPACGEGHIAVPLREYFEQVFSSDIHPGYDNSFSHLAHVCDFLDRSEDAWLFSCEYFTHALPPDWIITNPPFPLASAFIQRGLALGARGVAMLCRNAFMESAGRYVQLWGENSQLAIVAPFIERVPMQLGSWDPKGSTATAYSWFIFLSPALRYANGIGKHPIVMPIPPGTKKRLSRPDDAEKFGAKPSTPLFHGENA